MDSKSTTNVAIVETSVVILNKVGLHARPARLLVQTAALFQARIQIYYGDKTANAKSIVSVLKLGAAFGDTLVLHAEGEDAQQAIETLTDLVYRKFDEEE
ncbi:MAG TPA: HPr family phosphocarrier protein [Ktedonobacteraceae bacterium]